MILHSTVMQYSTALQITLQQLVFHTPMVQWCLACFYRLLLCKYIYSRSSPLPVVHPCQVCLPPPFLWFTHVRLVPPLLWFTCVRLVSPLPVVYSCHTCLPPPPPHLPVVHPCQACLPPTPSVVHPCQAGPPPPHTHLPVVHPCQACVHRSTLCGAGHGCAPDPHPAELPPGVASPAHGAQVHDLECPRLPCAVHLPWLVMGTSSLDLPRCPARYTLDGLQELLTDDQTLT